jgi:membrane-associated phospholipid phosphatase
MVSQKKRGLFFRTISQLGSMPVYLLSILLLFFFDSSWLFLQLLLMTLITTLIVLVLKLLLNTHRPNHIERTSKKKPSQRGVYARVHHIVYLAQHRSFPSAHASRAAGLLMIIILYLQQAHLIVLASVFCLLVMYSRVALRDHRLKDVIVGMIIGLLAGYASFVLAEQIVLWYFSSPDPLVYEVVLLA